MANQIFAFQCTVPAGTAIATPFTQSLVMPPQVISSIEVIVPPGPRGQMGFQIGSSGNQILPADFGTWFVTDDERVRWDLTGQITSGGWEFFGYNLGIYAHSVYLRFLADLTPEQAQGIGGQPFDLAALSG